MNRDSHRSAQRARLCRLACSLVCVVIVATGVSSSAPRALAAPNGASTWTSEHSGTTADLMAVSFTDARRGHAVGSGGTILETSDGGSTWIRQYACTSTQPCVSSSSDVITRRLLAVDFVDPFHGWIAGEGGIILATTDGGTTWTQQLACAETSIDVVRQYCNQLSADRVTVDLHGVSFVDPLRGWVVGSKETILTTADSGHTWVEQIACLWGPRGGAAANRPCPPRPQDVTPRDLLSVSFVDATHGMAVGTHGLAINTGDGGESWERNQGNAALDLRAVTMVVRGYADPAQTWFTHQSDERQDTAHAVGLGGTLLISGPKGSYWYGTGGRDQFGSQPPATEADLNAVDFCDRVNGIAVGDEGTIERTTDEGAAWHTEASGTTAALRGAALPDANDAYVVGDGGVVLALHTVPVGLSVTGVTPRLLSTAGQLPVTITGIGFTGAEEVSFGKAWARGFTVDSDHQITAIPPPLPAGSVHVTVTNRGMTSEQRSDNLATIQRPGGGTWTTVGSCPERCDAPAVRLRDGRVLVEGGHANAADPYSADATAAAELYDPATERWTATSPMHTPRLEHTATLLADGRVLVAGGWTRQGSGQLTAAAEIYDPSSGRWVATGSMHSKRVDFSAVLLPSGKVLVAGGRDDPQHYSNTAELYDPVTGKWTTTGSMHSHRVEDRLVLLRTGRVLVVGNTDASNDPSAELYDPVSGRWTETGALEVPRSRVTATQLADGRVLVTGGRLEQDAPRAPVPYPFAEIYDPTVGTWQQTGPMVFSRVDHAAITLPDGRVVVLGGTNLTWRYCPPCDPMSDVEIYDPSTSVWRLVTSMNEARGSPTAVLLNDDGILVTGQDGSTEVFHVAITPGEAAAHSSGWLIPLIAAVLGSMAAIGVLSLVLFLRRRRRGPPGHPPQTPSAPSERTAVAAQ